MSDEIQEREVARRLFAAEFDDATLSYSESDEERAPNYVVTPTGARVNRLFAVGALTEVESVNDDVLRGRIADPTGAFVTYGGQYQPDAAAFLERATPPCFVSITGKGRTYQPEDGDRIFTSVRPESLNEVDADTRDRWLVAAAAATLDRLATMAAALELDVRGDDLRTELEARGVDAALASGIALAIDHYRPTEHYLEAVRRLTVQALELVAGDRDSVETLDVDPGEAGPDELGPLPDVAAAAGAVDDTGAASAPDPADEGAAGDAAATDHAADAAADATNADDFDPAVVPSSDPDGSVHLASWPDPLGVDADAEGGHAAMAVVGALRRYKSERQLPLTAPIDAVEVYADVRDFEADITGVMHVTDLTVHPDAEPPVETVTTGVDLAYATVGPTYGDKVGDIEAGIADGAYEVVDDELHVAGETLAPEAFSLEVDRRYTGEGELLEADGVAVIVRSDSND